MYQIKINGIPFWPLVKEDQLKQITKELTARGLRVVVVQAASSASILNPIVERFCGVPRDQDLRQLGLQNVEIR